MEASNVEPPDPCWGFRGLDDAWCFWSRTGFAQAGLFTLGITAAVWWLLTPEARAQARRARGRSRG